MVYAMSEEKIKIDMMDLSDEEIANSTPEELRQKYDFISENSEEENTPNINETEVDENTDNEDNEQDETNTDENQTVDETDSELDEKENTEPEEVDEESTESAIDDNEIQDFYKKVTGKFKADNKEYSFNNADDIIRLMQMGTNYNRKMQAYKKDLKLAKILQKAGLDDEQKLANLIDISQHNPAAIGKLLKDAKYDEFDINEEEVEAYKPKGINYTDKQYNLEEVLNELKTSQHGEQVLDVVANQWDNASKQEVADNPMSLKILESHMSNGVYGAIQSVVDKERALGNLTGLTDIQAYKYVGDALDKQGMLSKFYTTNVDKPSVHTQGTTKSTNADTKKKRKQASSPTGVGSTSKSTKEIDFLAMSDEEFAKYEAALKR